MTTRTRGTAAAVLAATLLLSGCAVGAAPPERGLPVAAAPELLPGEGVEGSALVLFNRFTQRLVAYDPATSQVVPPSTAPTTSQYGFPTASPYYTTGNSAGTGFRVVRVEGRGVDTVVTLPDGEGVFPLATDGEVHLFTRSEYRADGRETRRALVTLEGDRLVEHPEVTGAVDRGAVLRGQLYYTTYEPSTDDWSLRRVPVADRTARPELVRTGLQGAGVHVHEGRVVTTTADRLVSGERSWPCVDLCWFEDAHRALLRLRVDEQAGLSLDVLDTRDGRLRATRGEVVDFAVEGATLVVYREGSVDRLDLRSGT